ncbi:nitrate reductase [Salinarchaeum chitinilyticum]
MTELVPTTCMRCAVGCGHVQRAVETGYGLDVVRGDPAHPVNRGLGCQRGVSETADPEGEWLTQPLVRRDGELVPTTWDTALTHAAEHIDRAASANPDAVAVLGSGQQTNEAAYLLGKVARAGIGTRHYDANTTLCMASAVTAYYDAFGSDAPPPTYDDIPEADTHLIWGANPAVAHPVMFRWIRESAAEQGSRLIVVDPVETDTAELADEHVQLEPGSDLALARGVLAAIVDRDGVDEEFVAAHTEGFDELVDELPSPAEAAETAVVGENVPASLADALSDDTLIYWGMGVNQSVQGTATAGALIDCCLATGNLGPGAGPFSLTGQANSMGTRVCSSKGSWPGHREFDDPAERETVADAWDVPVARLADDTGPGPVGIVEAMEESGPVDVCWTVATNPAAGVPDASAARERLEDTFLIVQDAFRTETVELADVVLPAATWGESEGTAINMERRISRVRAATETPTGVKTDLELIAAIGERVCPWLLEGPSLEPADVFREFAELTAGTDADCSGVSYERLTGDRAVRWPAPTPTSESGYRYYDPPLEEIDASADADGEEVEEDDRVIGTAYDLEGTWEFPTPSGKARFSSETHQGLPEPPDEEFPLTLTTARQDDGYNTGVRTRDDELAVARVSPATAAAHDDRLAGPDDRLRIESRRGSLTAVVEADDAVPDGLVWLPIHHPAVNDLTLPDRDPRSDEPNLKQCAVRLVAPKQRDAVPEPAD